MSLCVWVTVYVCLCDCVCLFCCYYFGFRKDPFERFAALPKIQIVRLTFFFFFFFLVCVFARVLRCGIWVHIRHNYVWVKTIRRRNVNKQQPGLCFEAKSPRQRQGNLFKISPSPATLFIVNPGVQGGRPLMKLPPFAACRLSP